MRRLALAAVAAATLGCGGAPVRSRLERGVIVASELGPDGMRLVGIAENGDSQFALVVPAAARDIRPAISPDGAWVVFASTRERVDGTSLWIVPLGIEGVPVRLTSAGIDSHPTWTPDGRAIVFASTRARGDFDLWRLAIANGRAAGDPERLTSATTHEVMPSVARDGSILYAAVTVVEDPASPHATSRIEERTPGGAIRAVTEGPTDGAPAVSPDGGTIVFTRGIQRTLLELSVVDTELWRVARRPGARAAPLVELPLTDEEDPVWSPDGRYVFATSVLRGADRRALFSSVVHVDVRDTAPVARMLQDRGGAIPRLTPAIRPRALDAKALRADPEYLLELTRIMAAAIAIHKQQHPEPPPPAPEAAP
ncbi:MAG: PD40 domain-containing protein [Deltaproteobacteria bacterium]|nr:PD40 domain-containing protein [Deltaproteobacteria bacterium]